MANFTELPTEVYLTIFEYVLLTNPNPINIETKAYPNGYNPDLHRQRKEPEKKVKKKKSPLLGIEDEGATRRYLHPFVSLKLTCSRIKAMVEEFCAHSLEAGIYGFKLDYEAGRIVKLPNKTPPEAAISGSRRLKGDMAPKIELPLPSNTIRSLRKADKCYTLLKILWEHCVYCYMRIRRVAPLSPQFSMCIDCENRYAGIISCCEAAKILGFKECDFLGRCLGLRFVPFSESETNCNYRQYGSKPIEYNWIETYCYKRDVLRLKAKLDHERKIELNYYQGKPPCAKMTDLRLAFQAGLAANGIPIPNGPTTFSGISTSAPFTTDDPLETLLSLSPEFGIGRTDTVAETVRFAILAHRVATETRFLRDIMSYLETLGKNVEVVTRFFDTPPKKALLEPYKTFRRCERRTLEVDGKYFRCYSFDILDVGLFLLFDKEFLDGINSHDGLTVQQVFCNYLRVVFNWQGWDKENNGTLFPWSLACYPVDFVQPPQPKDFSNLPPPIQRAYYAQYPIPGNMSSYIQATKEYLQSRNVPPSSNLLNKKKFQEAVRLQYWDIMALHKHERRGNLGTNDMKRYGRLGEHGRATISKNLESKSDFAHANIHQTALLPPVSVGT